MTAIVRHSAAEVPAATRAGLLLPGLGHLLVGEWIVGGGLLALDAALVASAFSGFPRIDTILYARTSGQLLIHPVVALASWVVIAAVLWFVAYRRAWPRELSEEERNSNRQLFLRRLRRHRTGMMGLFGVAFLVTLTLLTPLLAPFDPLQTGVGPDRMPPSWGYPMGTDDFGRDVFSRLLYGGRISLTIGFVSVTITATVGTLTGATAGFVGGLVDRTLMWFTDLLLALPRLILLLTLLGLFRIQGQKSIFVIMVILGLTGWMTVARIVRAQVMSLRQQDFIQAARALGLSTQRILLRHLIPNAMAPVIVYCSLAIGGTILAEASLSFLGLGVPPPISTWGVMVSDGRDPLRHAPWIATFPGLAIVMAVMSFNLLGDGLRDALDPKLR